MADTPEELWVAYELPDEDIRGSEEAVVGTEAQVRAAVEGWIFDEGARVGYIGRVVPVAVARMPEMKVRWEETDHD